MWCRTDDDDDGTVGLRLQSLHVADVGHSPLSGGGGSAIVVVAVAVKCCMRALICDF